jgi:hypothetical protein
MRRRLVTGFGVLLVAAALLANEWVLARTVSDDGTMAPLTVARVQLVQVLLAVIGVTILALRRRLSGPAPLRAFMRESPRLSAMIVGSVLAAGLWLTLETAVGLAAPTARPATVVVTAADGTTGESVAEGDPVLGYRLKPNLDVRMRVTRGDGQLVYDIDVVSDPFGRRVTPIPAGGPRPHYILFFGCSFTWGDAVNGDETLPAAFARHASAYRPYNYAFRGWGPQQTIEQLGRAGLRSEVAEADGIAIYTAIDEHVRRAIGSMRITTGLRGGFPYYRLEADGRLARHDTFQNGRPWRQVWYDLAATSRILQHFNVDLPLAIGDDHLELVAAMLADARDRYRGAFGNDRFYVVLYPRSRILADLRPHLDRRGVAYFDYTDLFTGEARPTVIAGDGHPTPLAYDLVAARLARDLSPVLPTR